MTGGVRRREPHAVRADDIDDLLGTPARLAIVATMADGAPWTFTALRAETGLADGNLHVQTRKLVDGGFATRERRRKGGRAVTCFTLTARGREALSGYVRRLRDAVGDGSAGRTDGGGERRGELDRRTDPSRVW